MDLLALADFNLVARHGGFGKAARASGRPKATLSRRVAELEAALAMRLFERGARTLKLTQEGQALFAQTSVLLTQIDEVASSIASGGSEPKGLLRISAPLLFSQVAMGRLAASFALKYPKVTLEVTTDDRSVDMVEEGYDLVIRVNPAVDETLVGRIILRDRLVVVASPAQPRPAEGAAVPAVVRFASERSWRIRTADGVTTIAIAPLLNLSSMIMVRDAVLTGIGAACLPISLAARDLNAGRLVQWGEVDAPGIALWALYPTRRLLSSRVAAFLEHLREAFPQGTPEELAAYC